VKILGISGSLRRGSYNRSLLGAAARLLPDDVGFKLWGGLKEVPPYDEDDDTEDAPDAVAALREVFAGADAVFATPEYNSSVPGQLKNAIDWVSRPLATNPLRSKPVAVVGASIGAFGAVWSQAELRKVLAATGARVVEGEVAVGHAPTRFDGMVGSWMKPARAARRGRRAGLVCVALGTTAGVGLLKSGVEPVVIGLATYVWRHLPLNDVHPRAQLAAEATEAAAEQGAFWEMHDLLLGHQDALRPSDLIAYAEQVGLDVERFTNELRSHAGAARVAEDVDSADLSGVSGTPTFFVNGRRHYGAYDIAALSAAVRAAGARAALATMTTG
jgi:NAD(P)H-dependent FMN reductase